MIQLGIKLYFILSVSGREIKCQSVEGFLLSVLGLNHFNCFQTLIKKNCFYVAIIDFDGTIS